MNNSKNIPIDEQMQNLLEGNPPSPDAGIFGATLSERDCRLMIIPVPWDATASYNGGTSRAPDAIRLASHQLDLEDLFFGRPYLQGIGMLEISKNILTTNKKANKANPFKIQDSARRKNKGSAVVNDYVYSQAKRLLGDEKLVGVLGGEHSVPFGLIKALSEKFDSFGIVHIDAHHDLRVSYEDLNFSHASIMHNILESFPQVTKLCQIGIRDFSCQEREYAKKLGDRGKVIYWQKLFEELDSGRSFKSVADEVSSYLPKKIYISFDIDGLDPSHCPNTGAPVPGGLSFSQVILLLEKLSKEHNIIGFDLCEVVPEKNSEWNCNVGARILYKLCGAVLKLK